MRRLDANHEDGGFTLIEILAATALFAVVSTLLVSLLVKTHEIFRQVDATETYERTVRDFDEMFTQSMQSAIAIRSMSGRITDVMSPSAAVWTNIRYDFFDPEQGCLTAEITRTASGKPFPDYPTNIEFFTWRVGRYATVGGKSTCVKQPETAAVAWASPRWGQNPPRMVPFTRAPAPATATVSGWDLAWYQTIGRITYTRVGQDHGSRIESGATLPAANIAPNYS